MAQATLSCPFGAIHLVPPCEDGPTQSAAAVRSPQGALTGKTAARFSGYSSSPSSPRARRSERIRW